MQIKHTDRIFKPYIASVAENMGITRIIGIIKDMVNLIIARNGGILKEAASANMYYMHFLFGVFS